MVHTTVQTSMDHSRFLPTIDHWCIPARGSHCYPLLHTNSLYMYVRMQRAYCKCVSDSTISSIFPLSSLPSVHLSLFTLLLSEAPSITSFPSKECSRARARSQARIPVCALGIERTEFSMERGVRLVSATVLSRILAAVLFTENVPSEIKPVITSILL